MSATEMVYWTVGRTRCTGLSATQTISEAYTGAKLVKPGTIAISGDAGLGQLRDVVAAGALAPRTGPARGWSEPTNLETAVALGHSPAPR
jgi:hypothetical protein